MMAQYRKLIRRSWFEPIWKIQWHHSWKFQVCLVCCLSDEPIVFSCNPWSILWNLLNQKKSLDIGKHRRGRQFSKLVLILVFLLITRLFHRKHYHIRYQLHLRSLQSFLIWLIQQRLGISFLFCRSQRRVLHQKRCLGKFSFWFFNK